MTNIYIYIYTLYLYKSSSYSLRLIISFLLKILLRLKLFAPLASIIFFNNMLIYLNSLSS